MPLKIQTWPPFLLARNHLQEVTLMASTISSTPIDFEEEISKISFLVLSGFRTLSFAFSVRVF